MVWYKLVGFGHDSKAEFKTINELMNESITKVGIELLGELKRKSKISPWHPHPAS